MTFSTLLNDLGLFPTSLDESTVSVAMLIALVETKSGCTTFSWNMSLMQPFLQAIPRIVACEILDELSENDSAIVF